ncbi:MAG: hypothetical protein MJZ22_03405 [Candidatus Saccharibacteria bacterium]|nr:hypothetical protein [Candidatus Saccharibacteria bacterium]
MDTNNFTFMTHEPTFIKKLLGAYWTTPKSKRLKEFKLENGQIYISVMSGQEFSAPVEECSFWYGEDGNRLEVKAEAQEKKIHFMINLGALEEDETEQILAFIKEDCNAKELALYKSLSILEKVKDLIQDPIGTVTDIAIDLFIKGSVKKKIVVGLCAVVVVVGCVIYFNYQDKEETAALACKLTTDIVRDFGSNEKCERVELGNSIDKGERTIYPYAKAFFGEETLDIEVTVFGDQVQVRIPSAEDE